MTYNVTFLCVHMTYYHGKAIGITYSECVSVKLKVKQSRNRPGVAQRVPGGLDSQIS